MKNNMQDHVIQWFKWKGTSKKEKRRKPDNEHKAAIILATIKQRTSSKRSKAEVSKLARPHLVSTLFFPQVNGFFPLGTIEKTLTGMFFNVASLEQQSTQTQEKETPTFPVGNS